MKMARSAHAYVRGNTVKFYEWLNQSDRAQLPDGPSIWICGDCHVGNLGPVANLEGHVDIQIRDLDQTVIGNPAHDLVRLGLSLAMAARSSDLPGATTALMVEEMVKGYCEALSGNISRRAVKERQSVVVGDLMRNAIRRRWKHLAKERIEDTKPIIPLSERFWAISSQERKALDDLVESEGVQALLSNFQLHKKKERTEILDAAYWVKGCSSLGLLRYAVLVGTKKKSAKGAVCFLDIKQAIAAAAPKSPDAEMPRDNGVRVVSGATALSPNLGERMASGKIAGQSVFVRELMPQDLKLEIEALTPEQSVIVARYLSGVVGHSHARQLDRATRESWRKEIQHFSKKLDAPSWLWNGVLELVGSHEQGYLEHCRKHALSSKKVIAP